MLYPDCVLVLSVRELAAFRWQGAGPEGKKGERV